jgi:hypothetical protein
MALIGACPFTSKLDVCQHLQPSLSPHLRSVMDEQNVGGFVVSKTLHTPAPVSALALGYAGHFLAGSGTCSQCLYRGGLAIN